MIENIIGNQYPFTPREHQLPNPEELKLDRINLDSDELHELVSYFEPLTKSLKELYNGKEYKVISSNFWLEFFLTSEGQKHLQDTFLLEKPIVFNQVEHVARFFDSFDFKSSKDDLKFQERLKELEGNSKIHAINVMADKFVKDTPINQIQNPTRISNIHNPDVVIKKFSEFTHQRDTLRNLSRELKQQLKITPEDNLIKAKLRVIGGYRRRLSEMVASNYHLITKLLDQNQIIQSDPFVNQSIKNSWKDIIKKIPSIFNNLPPDKIARRLSRFDKFIHGIGEKYSDNSTVVQGDYTQIDSLSRQTALDKLSEQPQESEIMAHLKKIKMPKKIWIKWASKYLKSEGLLSKHKEYNPNRAGPAKDGGWQLVTRKDNTNFSKNPKQKVIKIPGSWDKNIFEAIVLLDHELRHLLQQENSSKIPLSIFEVVRMDRSTTYAEAGAVNWESSVYQEFFNYQRPTTPDYHLAAIKKLEGGSFKECAYAFYQSRLQRYPQENINKLAKYSIDRTMRLFNKSGDYNSNTPYLSNSKPLAYLEQELLAQSLKKTGHEWLIDYSGLNLQSFLELESVGLINRDILILPNQRPTEFLKKEIQQLIQKELRSVQ